MCGQTDGWTNVLRSARYSDRERRAIIIERKHYWNRPVAYPMCLSVCLSVRTLYCGKTADWIWMSFGVVSGVGREIGVLDGVVIVEWEGAVLE